MRSIVTMSDCPPHTAKGAQTLADLLFLMPTPALRQELEQYRIGWEAAHGPTDLTRRYTSQLAEQATLFRIAPERYFEGLPPFVKAFIRGKFDQAKEHGVLDDMPAQYLGLYLSGVMAKTSRGTER